MLYIEICYLLNILFVRTICKTLSLSSLVSVPRPLLSVYILLLLLLWPHRAFGEPPKRALLYWNKHFRTDELLGAWLFLFGTVPAVPYTLVFFLIDPSFTYLGRHK